MGGGKQTSVLNFHLRVGERNHVIAQCSSILVWYSVYSMFNLSLELISPWSIVW